MSFIMDLQTNQVYPEIYNTGAIWTRETEGPYFGNTGTQHIYGAINGWTTFNGYCNIGYTSGYNIIREANGNCPLSGVAPGWFALSDLAVWEIISD